MMQTDAKIMRRKTARTIAANSQSATTGVHSNCGRADIKKSFSLGVRAANKVQKAALDYNAQIKSTSNYK
jgi:hypothetical protein